VQDLVAELKQAIRAKILAKLGPPTGDPELNSKDLGELLAIYGNWRLRFVPPRSRQVHRSSELSANPKAAQYAAALDAIESDIKVGADLTPYLSRGITHSYVSSSAAPAKMHQRRDRDLMIAEWGVHHLHLSTRVEADGFVERSGDLLFAAFREGDAYLIDIYPHDDSWALEDVVRTAVRNWPQARLFYQLPGAVGLGKTFSNDERLQLRKAGVTSAIEIDGHVYMPPGQTTAGTSISATQASDVLQIELSKLRGALSGNPDLLDDLARQEGYSLSPGTRWTPQVNATGEFGFAREGHFVFVGHLP
jgi:hypothetical protein